ncbi:Kef-type K+ transport system, membrane component [Halalkaliarchaeum desulfuricum]|uniref:Kef-type K+ transport system, membrane component n=1 Tax=Halalkaliarchaeum desulfuricum TaxID=2055893 RepID=A0A343TFP1_9EURY|nr:cation:proton antiporter [Halalkaliarchaeum desulfuricum]AUX07913.1 Kef-type K+ transport system, membrane component [Halalkaliarchaeum desulfuricum]
MVAEAIEPGLLTDFGYIIVAAAVVGFLAARTGQPTIIAYILTGLLLGPAVFGLVSPSVLTETMAELGLAFLLFLLGIKMRIDEIRHVLAPIVKISIPQMALVALVGFGTALLLGFSQWESVIIGLAVMYSSTAVIIKMLTDKGTATTLHGKIDIGVLLVQDIVVVILLAILAAGQPDSAVDVLTTLGIVLALVVAIGVVAMVASRYVLPPIFRRIADDTQVFFLIAISWVFLFLFVSQELDLSIEMGAFLAGIAIAQMPYSKELQAKVAPLTDLFILVFFVSVSLELEAADLFTFWQEAVIAALVLIPAKFVVFFYLIDWQGFDIETTFLGSVNMMQVSEFGLIVGAVAVTGGFIDEGILGFLTLVALLTMSLSVYFIKYNASLFERVRPALDRWAGDDEGRPELDEYHDHVVVVGFDEIARRAMLLLDDRYEQIVVIDRNVSEIDAIEAAGYDAIFGDAKYEKIRKEARVKYADFVFSSSVQTDVNELLLEDAGADTTVFVEAEWPQNAIELYDQGADFVAVTPQLSAEQLQQYLVTYLTNPSEFEDTLRADLEILRSEELFPQTCATWRSSDD